MELARVGLRSWISRRLLVLGERRAGVREVLRGHD